MKIWTLRHSWMLRIKSILSVHSGINSMCSSMMRSRGNKDTILWEHWLSLKNQLYSKYLERLNHSCLWTNVSWIRMNGWRLKLFSSLSNIFWMLLMRWMDSWRRMLRRGGLIWSCWKNILDCRISLNGVLMLLFSFWSRKRSKLRRKS